MANVITTSFHNSVAEDVLNEILSNTSKYYYYFGNTVNVPEPEVPANTQQYIAQTRRNIIFMKQIASNEVSFVLLRNDWVSGTRYNRYENDNVGNMTNFWVMTDTFDVYKCLDNGYANSVSTIKPTGSDVDPFVTADGYKWKFMYNVPLSLRNKFMNSAYIPVANGIRNRFFGSGEIDSVIIENNGVGYTQLTTTLTITGDGTGAAMTPVVVDGQIVSVVIDNPGTGYTYANVEVVSSVVTIPADKASIVALLNNGNINSQQAIIENLTTPGTIDSISIKNAGIGFTSVPLVQVTGDGTGCLATAEVVAGSLTKINIVSAGSGYTWANVTLGQYGSATSFVLNANVSPPLGHGRDAIKELYADILMFYGTMSGEKVSGFSITNDFQQFGLIKNVRSVSFDSNLVDQNEVGKVTIYTTSSITAFNVSDQITNVSLGETFTITSKQVGGSLNALELIPAGNYVPSVSVVYTRVGHVDALTVANMKISALSGARVSTACYTADATYDAMVYLPDTVITKDNHSYIIVAATTGKLLLQALDGGVLNNGDVLHLGNQSITLVSVAPPAINTKTGDILTIDNRNSFTQSQEQSVSTRTVIRF